MMNKCISSMSSEASSGYTMLTLYDPWELLPSHTCLLKHKNGHKGAIVRKGGLINLRAVASKGAVYVMPLEVTCFACKFVSGVDWKKQREYTELRGFVH